MNAIGIDINPEYKQVFLNRLGLFEHSGRHLDYQVGDARTMLRQIKTASVEFALTSPPYWDILHRRRTADLGDSRPYTDDPRDLGNIDEYSAFVSTFEDITVEVARTLRHLGAATTLPAP
ncbi:MAG: hypothetical protein F4Y11_11705 [Chloroflexi bacterium]|nr:hypothetical protein [Chloroflexota bacterium]